ncbi:TetR/AcrR family transcriptional regulator [Solimonas fluminis]|uniref:TetR/AcrR family transcriptional regulator n=2 Tax=Solimonas fluminis TaxID=2086571 RepID=A0A2S5TKI7_9GAMM|nr:TetR/AcrR family transcriptional regulator [Solimonas fluminis]
MSNIRMSKKPLPSKRRVYGGVNAEQRVQERRERLLATALELFATQGYQNTPIEQLCADAKVTTRHFYEAFAGREALLLVLYERIIREAQGAVREALQRPGLDLAARIPQVMGAFIETYVRDRRRAQVGVLEVVGVSPAVEKRRREVIREFAQVLEGYADSLVAQGLLPRRNYHPVSLALVGGINELLAEWLMSGDPGSLQQLHDAISDVMQALLLGGAAMARQEKGK